MAVVFLVKGAFFNYLRGAAKTSSRGRGMAAILLFLLFL